MEKLYALAYNCAQEQNLCTTSRIIKTLGYKSFGLGKLIFLHSMSVDQSPQLHNGSHFLPSMNLSSS